MQSDWRLRGLSFLISLVLFISLACSSLPSLLSKEEPNIRPTRTRLPTFTPTSATEMLISILPTPTDTPTPLPPTDTPTPEPLPTDTPPPAEEPTATDTPVPPPPTQPPPSPPTEPPSPTDTPAPAAQNGVVGEISFRDGRNTYGVGEQVFVRIEATNVESGLKPFGVLGLTASNGSFQTSWDNGTIPAGETFRHEDGMAFPSSGTYKMWLSICFSSREECQGSDGNWVRFEPGLDVIIQ